LTSTREEERIVKMTRRTSKIALCFLVTLVGLLAIPPHVAAMTYTYDESGRLETVRYDDGVVMKYQYDSAGNIISKTVATVTEPQSHLLESDHASFKETRSGRTYVIRLKNGETAQVSVQMVGEGNSEVSETEVTATARGVDIDTTSQSTTNGKATFTITGKKRLIGRVTFTTEVGTLKLLVLRSFARAAE
jgi:YD repeat-containing protein